MGNWSGYSNYVDLNIFCYLFMLTITHKCQHFWQFFMLHFKLFIFLILSKKFQQQKWVTTIFLRLFPNFLHNYYMLILGNIFFHKSFAVDFSRPNYCVWILGLLTSENFHHQQNKICNAKTISGFKIVADTN